MFARTFRPNSMRSRSVSNLRGKRSNFVRCRVARDPDFLSPRELDLADPPLEPDDVELPLEVEPAPLADPAVPLLVPLTGDTTLVGAEPVALPAAP
jgi:hypothetical protein